MKTALTDLATSRGPEKKRLATGVIDVHAHVVPQVYVEFLRARNVAIPGMSALVAGAPAKRMCPMGDAPEHLAERLRLMDEGEVLLQILSAPFQLCFEHAPEAVNRRAKLRAFDEIFFTR